MLNFVEYLRKLRTPTINMGSLPGITKIGKFRNPELRKAYRKLQKERVADEYTLSLPYSGTELEDKAFPPLMIYLDPDGKRYFYHNGKPTMVDTDFFPDSKYDELIESNKFKYMYSDTPFNELIKLYK